MSFDRASSCLTKRPYSSEQEALATAKDIRKKAKLARYTGLQAYKCRWCEYWHLGHSRRKR